MGENSGCGFRRNRRRIVLSMSWNFANSSSFDSSWRHRLLGILLIHPRWIVRNCVPIIEEEDTVHCEEKGEGSSRSEDY